MAWIRRVIGLVLATLATVIRPRHLANSERLGEAATTEWIQSSDCRKIRHCEPFPTAGDRFRRFVGTPRRACGALSICGFSGGVITLTDKTMWYLSPLFQPQRARIFVAYDRRAIPDF